MFWRAQRRSEVKHRSGYFWTWAIKFEFKIYFLKASATPFFFLHFTKYCNGFDQRVARQQLCKHGSTRNNSGICVFGQILASISSHMCIRGIFPGAKYLDGGAELWNSSNTKVRDVWTYIFTPPYIFLTWCLTKQRDSFSSRYVLCSIKPKRMWGRFFLRTPITWRSWTSTRTS
jgi:hypothetical protein